MKKYELSEAAEGEILDNVAYIAADNPVAAEKWLDQIERVCLQLGRSPRIGRERPELAGGIRSFPVGRFVIFYQPHPDGVYIVHVLRGAMDVERIFSDDI